MATVLDEIKALRTDRNLYRGIGRHQNPVTREWLWTDVYHVPADDFALLLAVVEAAAVVLEKFYEIDADATSVDDCRKRLECSRGWAVALLKMKRALSPLIAEAE